MREKKTGKIERERQKIEVCLPGGTLQTAQGPPCVQGDSYASYSCTYTNHSSFCVEDTSLSEPDALTDTGRSERWCADVAYCTPPRTQGEPGFPDSYQVG